MRLSLPLPPSTNHMYRGRRYKTRECEAWQEGVRNVARNARPVLIPKGTQVGARITMYIRTRRDIDGSLKALLDCLQEIAYENDDQIATLAVEKLTDRNNPRIEIEIFPLP